MKINILYEDNYVIVCEKPAGVPSQSDKTLDYDMVSRLKNYINETSDKKTPPYIGLIHRLDKPVGGIMVFAKNPFAVRELNKQLNAHKIEKHYLAVLTGDLSDDVCKDPQKIIDYIAFDKRNNISKIILEKELKQNPMAKKAELIYQLKGTASISDSDKIENEDSRTFDLQANDIGVLSLAEINLLTGRHHQIRVQMQHNKYGLWGDSKYNPLYQNRDGWHQIALYAYSLAFIHPKSGKRMAFCLYPEQYPFRLFKEITAGLTNT